MTASTAPVSGVPVATLVTPAAADALAWQPLAPRLNASMRG